MKTYKEFIKLLNEEKQTSYFQTSLGSVYKVHDDGTTTRNKSVHNVPGHEGDEGLKKRSHKTVYLHPDHMGAVHGMAALGVDSRRVVIDKGHIASVTRSKGVWGKSPSHGPHPYSEKPIMGYHPIELWDKKNDIPNGIDSYSEVHPGNVITRMQ